MRLGSDKCRQYENCKQLYKSKTNIGYKVQDGQKKSLKISKFEYGKIDKILYQKNSCKTFEHFYYYT